MFVFGLRMLLFQFLFVSLPLVQGKNLTKEQ